MTDAEEFIMSTYETVQILSVTNVSKVCLVRNNINQKLYVQRILPTDYRPVYTLLKKCCISGIPKIFEIIYDGKTVVFEEYIEGTPLSTIATALSFDSF